jgi:subtilisin family serine protease
VAGAEFAHAASELVRLPDLMALTSGSADLVIGLVDGPVALDHPDLVTGNVRALAETSGVCRDVRSASCRHGTFVAGILAARRGAQAPAIAPGCTLVVRPIFSETGPLGEPSATPGALAEAIVDCVHAGARLLNLSAALAGPSLGAEHDLGDALEYSLRHGVLVVAAAGNQGALAGSVLTRHRWVIPVVGYSRSGRLLAHSNLGRSVGSGGLGAPGEGVVSLTPEGEPAVLAGTSVAAPFVTGTAALLWSAFPRASAVEIKHALLSSPVTRRRTLAPPLLDAWGAYKLLSESRARRTMS